MLYVGLTEKQQESASIFLGLMGDQVSGRLEALQQESGKQNVSAPGQVICLTMMGVLDACVLMFVFTLACRPFKAVI
jgi:hypothetical protein